jgi:uncharacterized damage-inducible protein DinB
MDATEREQILKLLAQTRETFIAATTGISDEQARIRPAPDQWSVLDCAEHVAIAEFGMLNILATNLTPAPPSGDRGREEIFLRGSADRTRKFNAPERAHPPGRFPSLVAALHQFHENHARIIEFVEHCDKDMRAHSISHPAVGPVTGQEFLILMAPHPARHAEQIREVRQTIGFVAR